jgi:hypothetical protein
VLLGAGVGLLAKPRLGPDDFPEDLLAISNRKYCRAIFFPGLCFILRRGCVWIVV